MFPVNYFLPGCPVSPDFLWIVDMDLFLHNSPIQRGCTLIKQWLLVNRAFLLVFLCLVTFSVY